MSPSRSRHDRTSPRARVRIGCSGYDYPSWHGGLYPEDLPASQRFAVYARTFDCVELNATFRRLPGADAVDAWRSRAPDGFEYALKLSRYATHMKHLADPEAWLDRFVAVVRRLGDHAGPVLVQLPPHWNVDPGRLAAFLAAAPDDVAWAVEVRDPRWLDEAVIDRVEDAGATLVLHDLIARHPREPIGAWSYVRYHGPDRSRPYHGGYPHQRLVADARRFAPWIAAGRRLHAFFNNDADGHAPRDARRLRRYLLDALDAR